MSELLIIPQQKVLNKTEKEFNKLVKRIDKRKKDLKLYTEQCKLFSTKMLSAITKPEQLRQNSLFAYTQLFEKAYNSKEFSGKKYQEKLIQMIINLCKSAAKNNMMSTEMIDMQSKYLKMQSEKMTEEEKEMGKQMMEDMFEQMYGIKMDIDKNIMGDFEKLSAEMQEKFQEKMHEQKAEFNSNRKNKTSGGNSKKQNEKAELLNKSWKKIYYNLVRALHPDKEVDPNEKHKYTEAMKEITAAYESSDFYKLLLLHLQYNHLTGNAIQNENEEVLKQYIATLKKQDKELKENIDDILYEARDSGFVLIGKPNANSLMSYFIDARVNEIENETKGMQQEIEQLSDFKKLKAEMKNVRLDDLLNDDFFEDEFDMKEFADLFKSK
jgi:hypothetical protein